MLVITKDLSQDFDVKKITEAIFKGAAFLGIEGDARDMAKDISSLPLHPDAETYYQEASYLPSELPFDWSAVINATWKILAVMALLVGGYKGIIKVRRDSAANKFGIQILAISPTAEKPSSVYELLNIRDEIRKCVDKPWLDKEKLDRPRWLNLCNMIDKEISSATDNLTRSLIEDIHKVEKQRDMDGTDRRKEYESIHDRIGGYFSKGEINALHGDMLLKLLKWIQENK